MDLIKKIADWPKLGMAFLALMVIMTTYVISKAGEGNEGLITAIILGSGLGVYSIINFRFGFYLAVSVSFLVAFVDRLGGASVSMAFASDVLINVSFLGLIVHKVVTRDSFWKYANHTITYIYLLYTVYLFIEVFNPSSPSLSAWIFVIRKFLQFLMIYFTALNVLTDKEQVRFFVKFWAVWGFIAGGYGCYQEWFGLFDFEMNWIWSAPGRAGLYALDNGGFRKFSIVSGPAAYGILMAACGLFFGVLALREKESSKKIIFGVVSILSLLGMAYSGTRTAYFIFTTGIVLYILMTIMNRSTLIAACFFLMGFVVIMWGPIYGNVTVNRIRSTFDTDDSSLGVRDLNRAAIQPYIYSHPMGGGVASSGVQGLKYNPHHFLAGFPPDSGFVKTAIETGWIGLFLQCLLYCIILLCCVRTFYRSSNKAFKTITLAATVTIFSFVVSQYGQVSIGQIPDCFLFYSLLAVIVRLYQLEHQNVTDPKTTYL